MTTYLVPSAKELPSFETDLTEDREPDEPARGEGRGGDGDDRGRARGHQRGRRRAWAPRRRRHPDAGDARASLACDTGGEAVIPARFDYEVADSAEHALALLGEREDAKLIAGGHSLLPAMKLRLARPAVLVDIGRLRGAVVRPGRRRAHRDRSADPASRRARGSRSCKSTVRSSRSQQGRSGIRRSAIAERSAGRSRTAIPRPTCPR